MRTRFVVVGLLGTVLTVACGSQDLSNGGTSDGAVAADGTAGAGGYAPFTPDSSIPAGFRATGSMTVARTNHTATLLSNGKVLIAGGYDGTKVLASAELYDPAAGTFTATGSMTTARRWHTATLLPNGMVLIVSGSRAELYDPNTGTFMATGSSTVSRIQHTATLLPNGMVLITGGTDGTSALASAELYDPGTGTFTATGNLTVPRYQHAATLLPGGIALVAGGYVPPTAMYQTFGLTSAELYDPKTGVFTATGDMGGWNSSPIATLLPNGQVLMGGDAMSFEGIISDPTLELYDPAARTFASTGRMSAARACYTMTLLPSGLVLIAGGYDGGGSWGSFLASAELYDPGTGTCETTGSMSEKREFHTATLLANGTVLIAGGDSEGLVLASAELYQ